MRPLWLLSLVLVGCEPKAPADPTAASVVSAPVVSADAVCAPHGVLTAVCAKCTPAVAAVFQAKGDWCAEHGFAESFCPICHPEREGRPALAIVPDDDAPRDGTKIRFKTRETARLAGLEVVLASAGAPTATVSAVARVVYDGGKVAMVSAPVPGVISEVRADVGRRVRRGDTLAMVQSAAIGEGRSQSAAVLARVSAAELTLQRQRDMFAAGVASAREVQEAELALTAAQAERAGLDAQLRMVGVGTAGAYALVAPLSGEVTRREVSLGMGVEGGTLLYEIVDASTMWAEVDVPEGDLAQVRVGSAATLVLDSLPDRSFSGLITYIAPNVSVQTRTALARIALPNPDGALRGNMYGSAQIAVAGGGESVTVPSTAVQRAKGVDFVFVRLADDTFEARRVRVGTRSADEVTLLSGIAAGEPVVTTGSFLLKTETLKDSIGAGCCDVE